MFRDLQREQTVFTDLVAHRGFGAGVAYRGQTVRVQGTQVSGSYFPTLGLVPALGRLPGPEVDQPIGGHPVVVLSHEFSESDLGGTRDVLGDTLIVNGQPLTIVGVAPAGFRGTTINMPSMIFVPITMHARLSAGTGESPFTDRRNYWLYLFARLKPEVALARARAAIAPLYRSILTAVEAPLQTNMSDQTIAQFVARALPIRDGRRGQSRRHDSVGAPRLLLLGVTAVVLLIASAQHREPAAGAIGRACIRDGGATLARRIPAAPADATADRVVPPGRPRRRRRSDRGAMDAALRRHDAGQPGNARAAARFRDGLVVAQFALAMTLLVAAGLFVQSLRNVSRIDLGIRTNDVVTFRLWPGLNGYGDAQTRALYERVEAGLAAQPGVTGVTAASLAVFTGDSWGTNVMVEGYEAGPDADRNTRFNQIVGLVADSRYSDVKTPAPPLLYVPYRQEQSVGALAFYARGTLPPEGMLRTIPALVAGLDPNVSMTHLKTLPQQVQETAFEDRAITVLSAAFAGLAVLLAAVGLYGVHGVLAYTVAQRTRELGLRMALGADAARIRAMVLRQVGRMTLSGGVIGLVAALGLGRVAQSLLYEIDGLPPAGVAAAVVGLTAVALIAGCIPAQRASRIHPLTALRHR